MASDLHAQAICPLNGQPLKAKGIKSLKEFERIAILDGGRVKPLDTFARNLLMQFSGRSTYDRKPAIQWLAKHVFAPESTKEDKIFLINNPAIAHGLGIKAKERRCYSYKELEPSLAKLEQLARAADQIDSKKRDVVENELIRLYNILRHYALLGESFTFVFGQADFTIQSENTLKALELPPDTNQFGFIDIASRSDRLQNMMRSIQNKDRSQWTDEDKEIVLLTTNLLKWSMAFQNLPLTIVPSYKAGDESWGSPWEAVTTGLHSSHGAVEANKLWSMLVSYWNGDQLQFDLAAKAFSDSIAKRVEEEKSKPIKNIDLEILYNRLNLFFLSKIICLFVFLMFLLSFIRPSLDFRKIAFILHCGGFFAQLIAIIMRITILERPPVSNLYETFIFVGFLCVALGIIIERFAKNWLGLLIASIGGFSFLMIASKYAAEGDTLQMLVAVLNSNFWLGTHVLTITAGYAGVCAAGIVGHIYILQKLFKPHEKKLHESSHKVLIGTLGLGLTLAFLGTNLGGIWADQSWGRFWGWDPKENGALLIILWTAILFHLKVGRMVDDIGIAVGSILGIIVVMWAWFGVNLLSVGLHSYGFTHGLARNLILYVLLQVAFLFLTVPFIKRK